MHSMVAVVVRMRCNLPALKRNDEIAQQGVDGSNLTQGIHCTHNQGLGLGIQDIHIMSDTELSAKHQMVGIEDEHVDGYLNELWPAWRDTKVVGLHGPLSSSPSSSMSYASEAS